MRKLADELGKYFRIHAGGSGSPMREVGKDGVRVQNYGFSGGAQARIPIDSLIDEALLTLEAGGFTYGGAAKLPQYLQEKGAPPGEEWGDTGINNLGVGIMNGGFSAGANYNPQNNEKSILAKYRMEF